MISLRTLPLRSARYHWRSNLPVVLGVAVGAAVLAGALVVGDSLRGSLRGRALRQLNGVESAYVGPRLVRGAIAGKLPGTVTPALILQGSARYESPSGEPVQLGRVNVIGLSGSDLAVFGLPSARGWDEGKAVAIVSAPVAAHLHVASGNKVDLGVARLSNIPRSSLLSKRDADDVTTSLSAEVVEILPADHPMNDFNLLPNPAAPLNVFVPLAVLQKQVGQPDRVNALLAKGATADELNDAFAAQLTLDDWGIRVNVAPKRNAYVTIESASLVLDPATVKVTEIITGAISARSSRTIAYLANAISAGPNAVLTKDAGDPNKVIPYSVVAALNVNAAPPLGPFLPPNTAGWSDDEIALVAWPDSPLKNLKAGDPVTVTYFEPEMEAALKETSATFKFKGYVPFSGPADDPDLTPAFPGITDKLSIQDWKSPFEMNMRRIRPRDEKYWEQHKAAPKAYISLAAGERLFASRFGTATSIRVAPASGRTLQQTAEVLRFELMQGLRPKAAGLRFEPTRHRLLEASKGGTDFGGLFLMFSGLLIGAALLLVGLLFRLAMERRAKEIGLLLAAGYSPGRVLRVLLIEGVAVAVVGSLLGLAVAAWYARAMLSVLTTLWPDAEVGKFLKVHATPEGLVGGFVATVLVAAGTIWLSVRGLTKIPPPALLRGETRPALGVTEEGKGGRWSIIAAGLAGVIGAACLAAGGSAGDPDQRSMAFFGGGGLLLVAGLLLVRWSLRRSSRENYTRTGTPALMILGARNAKRNPSRSLLTATLIAVATFLVVSVESFRRKPDEDFLKATGGSGGFRLVAESDVPLYQPIDRGDGKDELLERLSAAYQKVEAKNPTGPSREALRREAETALGSTKVFSFRLKGGDDASCLNLFQAGRPRALGVPADLVARGGFQFAEADTTTAEEQKNPWLLLSSSQPDGAIPVFAEQNTAMFMLKTMVGGTLTIPDENGAEVRLRLVGTVRDSPFQSELLMSDENFRKLYPRQEGFRVFLIDVPAENESAVTRALETGLRPYGLTVTRTADRVATYQAVVGAYLTTFQLLGGFALLLAILGQGVVTLRSVWERAGELALLRAVGYRGRALQTLVLSETLLVLSLGLLVGVFTAIASVLPNLALGGSLPWGHLVWLLLAVAAVGSVVAAVATAGVARAPLIQALRED
ncbi:ABC transporter permease [Fimbriiglobus ruber]|uniref:Putative ABC transporter integral membrane protein n=1 Tax=Fimbriiglobus ruber TaxID=1908690 RepID=A0A225EGN2_9BACT|nr:ABC transporter permease [Fimbriiglobus ruber]OWK47475.1 putative ABC transporter integral membrane protein [Fimbriiglobus ruber]